MSRPPNMNTHKMFLVEELPRGHGWVWYCTNLSIPLAFSLYQLLPYFSQVVLVVKNLPTNAGNTKDTVWSLGGGRSLKEGMATHFSILAWRISWDRGAWWSTVHRVAQSQTRLKQLSTHHTSHFLEFQIFPLC